MLSHIKIKFSLISLSLFLSFSLAFAQETLFYNGKIYTGSDSFVDWFIVNKNGVIIRTGNNSIPPADFAQKINLEGKTVIPGFIDANVNMSEGGNKLVKVNMRKIKTKEDLSAFIQENKSLFAGSFMMGYLVNPKILDGENALQWLDKNSSDIPIILLSTEEKVFFNTPALRFFRLQYFITKNKLNGQHLNQGVIEKGGVNLVYKIMSSPEMQSQISQASLLRAQSEFLQYGITSVGDNTYYPVRFKLLRELQNTHKLPIRVFTKSNGKLVVTEKLIPTLKVKKIGIIGRDVKTKKLNNTLAKIPSSDLETLNIKQLKKLFHSNSNSLVLDIDNSTTLNKSIDLLKATKPRKEKKMVLENVLSLSDSQLETIRKHSALVNVPSFGFFLRKRNLKKYTKDKTDSDFLNYAHFFKTLPNAVVSSDWPKNESALKRYKTDGLNPFEAISSLVTGAQENDATLSLSQALKAYTQNAALLIEPKKGKGLPKVKLGKIASGYRADFTIINKDLFSIDKKEIASTKVIKTYIDGKLVFDNEAKQYAQKPQRTQFNRVNDRDYALSPAFGYSTTNAFIFGGAYFGWNLNGVKSFYDAVVLFSEQGRIYADLSYSYQTLKDQTFGVNATYSTFLENFFGDNARTKIADRGVLEQTQTNIETYASFMLNKKSSLKFNINVDLFKPDKLTINTNNDLPEMEADFSSFTQKEETLKLGVQYTYSHLDFSIAPKNGTEFDVSTVFIPSGFSSVSANDNLWLLTLELKNYKPLFSPNLILATHLATGFTLNGTPSYLQKFSLGGDYELRGFRSNRFRGKNFYTGSVELRQNVIRDLLDVVAFWDFGNMSNGGLNDFEEFNYTYGGGFRVNILGLSKLRFDFGKAYDEWGIVFTFQEAF